MADKQEKCCFPWKDGGRYDQRAGIGVGVAHKFKEPPLVAVSAATAGMVGGFAASKILAGTVLVDGTIVRLAGPGEPLGAFIAAYIAIVMGISYSGKTKIDILVTPVTAVIPGWFCK